MVIVPERLSTFRTSPETIARSWAASGGDRAANASAEATPSAPIQFMVISDIPRRLNGWRDPTFTGRSSSAPTASTLRKLDVVERRSQPARQRLGGIVGPEMHEEQARLVVEHVIVQRRDLD